MKRYKLTFDIWGLLLFLIIMIPNFIWFAVPVPNDVLRTNSITETIDIIASVCQALMVVALCFFRNREAQKTCATLMVFISAGCCFLYFLSWIVYSLGIVDAIVVVLGLTISPSLAFLFYAIDRKNRIAMIPISIFTICHLIYGVADFIV